MTSTSASRVSPRSSRSVCEPGRPRRWYADPAALLRVFEKLLLPLHTDVPTERVDMGGAMHER
jgi:hypothetical protein